MKTGIARAAYLLAVLFLGCPPAIKAGGAAEGSFDRTLKVSGAVDIDVTTGSGRIRVKTGDDSTVRVTGLIRAGISFGFDAGERVRYLESNPPIEQSGSLIRIGHITDERYRNNVSISYELVVPANARLRSKTGSGEQSVEGIQSRAEIDTGSGSLVISNIGGPVIARTGSGRVEIDSVKGRVEVSTGSGSIRASHIAGAFSGRTGSGDITMEQTAPGDVQISSGSGSLEASGIKGSLDAHTGSGHITAGGEPSGEWKIETGNGGITVHLGSNASFDLQAHTSSGHITLNHPLTLQGTVSQKDMRGKVRNGGPLLNLRTGSGNITVN